MTRRHILTIPAALFAALLLTAVPVVLPAQSTPNIVPRHPAAVQLPEVGRMTCDADCGFGIESFPLPDVNGDGIRDFMVLSFIRDTTWSSYPEELWVYHGVRDGFPNVDDYQRIAPTERGSETTLLAVGDFDGDGNVDLVTKIKLIGDTNYGNTEYGISRCVVWWGNAEGRFTLQDTTRLENGSPLWLGPARAIAADLNRDGADDLVLFRVLGFDGQVVQLPHTYIFRGRQGERWGRDRERRADSYWHSPPITGTSLLEDVAVIDHDGDGLNDLVFYHNVESPQEFGTVRVIYGRPDVLLDTANVVTVDLAPANGKFSLFTDITGDRIPELLVNTGNEETLKVYVGLRGQRLHEQFGGGNVPPDANREQWWGKPWAAIPLPGKLHDAWAASGWGDIYDYGDCGLDGIGDVWVSTVPDRICYNGGQAFDSLYDAWFRIPSGARDVTVLGDITGSGVPLIAVADRSIYGLYFLSPTKSVPTTGRYRQMVPGTDSVTDVLPHDETDAGLDFHAMPNPSSDDVRFEWNPERLTGPVTLTVYDALGGTVTTLYADAHAGEAVWDASDTFGGWYTVRLASALTTDTATTRVMIAH